MHLPNDLQKTLNTINNDAQKLRDKEDYYFNKLMNAPTIEEYDRINAHYIKALNKRRRLTRVIDEIESAYWNARRITRRELTKIGY